MPQFLDVSRLTRVGVSARRWAWQPCGVRVKAALETWAQRLWSRSSPLGTLRLGGGGPAVMAGTLQEARGHGQASHGMANINRHIAYRLGSAVGCSSQPGRVDWPARARIFGAKERFPFPKRLSESALPCHASKDGAAYNKAWQRCGRASEQMTPMLDLWFPRPPNKPLLRPLLPYF